MRLALDVMGGDHGCEPVLHGAQLALASGLPVAEIFAVGNEAEIRPALDRLKFADFRLKVVHASEVLSMTDKPVEGLRRKKDCSILRAMDLVKGGEAEAVISTGNTGGLLAASTIRLRTLPGVDRPGIATVIPTDTSQFVLLDSGANVGAKPVHLVQYAVMGSVYSRVCLGVDKPRVGLMANGTEETKGNELTQEALRLCRQLDLNFIGYVEGYDLFHNRVDVVVCDGFVGNIVLKTAESFARCLVGLLKKEFGRNLKRKLGAMLAYDAFRAIKERMDPDAYGGAPVLGLNGVVLKAHGSARERAIMNAIRMASGAIGHKMNDTFIKELAAAGAAIAPLLAGTDKPAAT